MKTIPFLSAAALFAALAGCKSEAPAEDTPEPTATEAEGEMPAEGETVSILRPDVEAEQEELVQEVLDPLNAVIGFPDGGDALDAAAVSGLEAVLGSQQIELGGPIVLRAHSDSAGSDRVNADAAQARGVAVAAWLVEQGVDEDRIEVIVFGEQNPVEPNALDNGEPNEQGRAANRRVEIEIPTVVLTVSTTDNTGEEVSSTETSTETGD